MIVQGLFAAAHVRDLADSEDFYTKLLGRGPDDRPFDGMIQWRGFGSAGIQLFADPDKAGQGVMTIVTQDVEANRSDLSEDGIELGAVQRGSFGAAAQLFDPDGNRINLVEPPEMDAAQ